MEDCHPERQRCHPEQQRGIYLHVLVARHENRMQDPSLTLGMTLLTLGMTLLTLGLTSYSRRPNSA